MNINKVMVWLCYKMDKYNYESKIAKENDIRRGIK